jgi:integrase
MTGEPRGPGKPKGARPNREGKPWKRADGRWMQRVYPPEGTIWDKPVHVYGKTRKECVENHDKKKAELSAGKAPEPGARDIKIGPYMKRWLYETLPQYVASGVMRQTTMWSYQENAELHIIPEKKKGVPTLAHVGMLELTAGMVREWQEGMLKKPSGRQRKKLRPGEAELPPPALLAPRTVAYGQAILQKALNDAIRDEVAGLSRNVVELVDPPGGRKKNARAEARQVARRVIRPEQAAVLLVAMAEDRLWCYWLVALAQGFRRGEGLGMKWTDLDFAARTWLPELQVQWLRGDKDPGTGKRKGRLAAVEVKTSESGEKIALTRTAAQALGRWEAEQNQMRLAAPRWAELGLVFTAKFGTALSPRNVDRAWEKLCEGAGVPGIRLHDLRHACASYALANGADIKTVQQYLRHARVTTTQLYLHAIEEVPRGAADAMDDAIAGLLGTVQASPG